MSITEIFDSMEYGPAPESPSLAKEWLESHDRQFAHFIGGAMVAPIEGGYFETFDPSKGEVLARVAQGSKTDVDRAVAAAAQALGPWQSLSGHERAKYLYAIARLIQKHSRLFAVIESMDNGKPIRETRDIDIPLVARHFYYHAGWSQLMETEMAGFGPVGVCGQIIPWNFPLLMLSWKIAPALAMGNTVILKPAEFTSLSALLFAEICQKAGVPAGVVNIVTGDGLTGKAMVEHPDIDKIAFTGSTEVGRILRTATAGTGKKLSLELGGKSPFVVFEDADMDGAVEGVVDAIWFNQGQVCCAGSRLLLQEGIADKFLVKLRARMDTLRVGDPLDKAVDIGAIVDSVQLARISELVQQGVAEGAELYQPNCGCPTQGWYYPPTLLTNVSPASTVAQVEIFGPVLVAMTFRTPAEAAEIANNTVYGLAASIWTENISLALDMAAKVKAGTVWVNCTNQFDAASGFGGVRESGYGREGGKEGLFEYVKPRTKVVETATEPFTPNPGAATIDRTHKLYIGGKQVRPDSGYSLTIAGQEVGRGNRKDVRNAVEAARAAQPGWAGNSGHGRAQVLYYFAENLEERRPEFVELVGDAEFEAGLRAIFAYAAWADKYESVVHQTPMRGLTYTLHEPIGTVGVVCADEAPLLGFLQLVLPVIAMGNTAVVVPSEANPIPILELYRTLDASDLPAGVLNIVTGLRSEIGPTLCGHDGVDSVWHFADKDGSAEAERLSVGNLKRTWARLGKPVNWFDFDQRECLRQATQVKNIWVPMGE